MMTIPDMVKLPIKTDSYGVIRVSGTRVSLDSIIGYYLQGESPEALHEGFPSVPLEDIYAVISYYLANRAELDAYLADQQAKGEQLRRQWEAQYPPLDRAELQARLGK